MKPVSARHALLEVLKDVEPISKYRNIILVQKKKHCNVYLNSVKVCKTDADIYTMSSIICGNSIKNAALKTVYICIDDNMQFYTSRSFNREITKEERHLLLNEETSTNQK